MDCIFTYRNSVSVMKKTRMLTSPRSNSRLRFPARLLTQLGAGAILLLVFVASAAATVQAPQTSPAMLLSLQASPSRTPSPTSTTVPPRATPASTELSRSAKTVSQVPGQPQVDANTVALYHFDTPNIVAVDATGNYTGTLVGNATILDSGLYEGVLSLDGNSSYVQTGNLGALSQGTIEAFVDFSQACNGWDMTILSAGGPIGSNQTTLWLGAHYGLMFGIYDGTSWHYVDSGINACRYLVQGGTTNPPPWQNIPVKWPYETWRFHHVAGTWGPRGMEIWVDGVLHGVGTTNPDPYVPYTYKCNPQMQEMSASYPRCQTPVPAPQMTPYPPPGDYYGGLAPYTSFLIGCDQGTQGGLCFRGRIDEVRISNVQRTFEWTVVPTITPTPTQTPVPITGEYAVDGNTLALYHLNAQSNWSIYDEVTQTWNAGLAGNATIASGGRFDKALLLDGKDSFAQLPNKIAGNGTVEMWINLSSVPDHFAIFSAGNTDGSDRIYLGINKWLGQSLVLTVYDANMNAYTVNSGFRPIAGCWHHVAGTWGTQGLQIWVDGTLRGTYGYYGAPTNTFSRELVGCSNGLACIQGLIDEVRMSSVQRTFTRSASFYGARIVARTATPRLPGAVTQDSAVYLPFIVVAPTPVSTPTPVCPN